MKFTQYLLLAAKGCAMGMADVVPGVSGGTIAFISGIYEELIESIKSVNGTALRLLGTLRLKEFWRHVNGRFLLPVLIGIGIAIFSLARLMTYLLTHHPIAIWSFFFGLIVASALLVARQIGHWNVRTVAACLVGAAAAWWITIATPTETPDTWWFIMLSGAIAICAMILPGISGAFILLLLGKYQFIMQAVGDLNIPVIVIFVVGAVAGIISFSHLLSWLLKHWHDVTVAVLMGFMVGSLNKVWPWKEVVETYTDSHGKIMPLVESNVAPGRFEALTQQDALLRGGHRTLHRGIPGDLLHRTRGAHRRQKTGGIAMRVSDLSAGRWGTPPRQPISRRNSNARGLPTAPTPLYELPEIGALERLLAETPRPVRLQRHDPLQTRGHGAARRPVARCAAGRRRKLRAPYGRLTPRGTQYRCHRPAGRLRLPARGRTALACPRTGYGWGRRRPCSMCSPSGASRSTSCHVTPQRATTPTTTCRARPWSRAAS